MSHLAVSLCRTNPSALGPSNLDVSEAASLLVSLSKSTHPLPQPGADPMQCVRESHSAGSSPSQPVTPVTQLLPFFQPIGPQHSLAIYHDTPPAHRSVSSSTSSSLSSNDPSPTPRPHVDTVAYFPWYSLVPYFSGPAPAPECDPPAGLMYLSAATDPASPPHSAPPHLAVEANPFLEESDDDDDVFEERQRPGVGAESGQPSPCKSSGAPCKSAPGKEKGGKSKRRSQSLSSMPAKGRLHCPFPH